MNCEETWERMLDILYGEETGSRCCFEFFQHVDRCSKCKREYLELLETRELLVDWKLDEGAGPGDSVPELQPSAVRLFRPRLRRFQFPSLGKIAAGFLILIGVISILQSVGLLRGPHITVSQPQLVQLVNDMIVERQEQERHLVGMALVRLKEDTDLQRRQDLRELYHHLVNLEEKYLRNLEENKLYLRQLVSR